MRYSLLLLLLLLLLEKLLLLLLLLHHLLIVGLEEHLVGFEDLSVEVVLISENKLEVNDFLVKEHSCDLTSVLSVNVFNARVDSVSDELLSLFWVSDQSESSDINLRQRDVKDGSLHQWHRHAVRLLNWGSLVVILRSHSTSAASAAIVLEASSSTTSAASAAIVLEGTSVLIVLPWLLVVGVLAWEWHILLLRILLSVILGVALRLGQVHDIVQELIELLALLLFPLGFLVLLGDPELNKNVFVSQDLGLIKELDCSLSSGNSIIEDKGILVWLHIDSPNVLLEGLEFD